MTVTIRNTEAAGSSGLNPAKLALGAGLIALFTFGLFQLVPVFYNPDANQYLGMALRLSRFDFYGAGHLLHSPLYAALMVPWIWSGADAYLASRLVNCLALAFVFPASCALAGALKIPRSAALAASLLTTAQLIPVALFLVTPDILVVALACVTLQLFCRIRESASVPRPALLGIMIGLSFLAKAFDLYILLFFLAWNIFLTRECSFSEWLKKMPWIFAGFVLVAAPWLGVLYLKAGRPIISGQAWILNDRLDPGSYHPDLNAEALQRLIRPEDVVAGVANVFSRALIGFWPRVEQILDQLFSLIMNPAAFLLLIVALLVFRPDSRGERELAKSPRTILSAYISTRICLYLLVGGPYLRFYLPVLALGNLVVASRLIEWLRSELPLAERFRAWQKLNQGMSRLATAGLMVLFLVTPLLTVVTLIGTSEPVFLQNARALEHLSDSRGPVTGNFDQQLTGYVAYEQGREFWGYIMPGDVSAGRLEDKLAAWKISQIIWAGEVPEVVRSSSSIRVIEHKGEGADQVTLFSVGR